MYPSPQTISQKESSFHPVRHNDDQQIGLRLYKDDDVFNVDVDATRHMWNILVFKSGISIPGIGYKDAGVYVVPVLDTQDRTMIEGHFEGFLLSVPFPFWHLFDIYDLERHFTSYHFSPFVELDEKEADNLCLLMSLIESSLSENVNQYSNLELIYLCRAFIATLNRHFKSKDNSYRANTTGIRYAKEFLNLVEKHCLKEKKLDFYAKQLGITTKYLSTTVSKNTGKTACKWISDCVIEKANKMLSSTSSQINEIAEEMGFDNASVFCRYYRACMGATPMQYRKESKRDISNYRIE